MAGDKPLQSKRSVILSLEWQVVASLLVISLLNTELTSRIVHFPGLSQKASVIIGLSASAILVVAVIAASLLKYVRLSKMLLVIFASYATIYLLTAIYALVIDLPNLRTNAGGLFLLRDAAIVLGINVVLFGVWYWLIDDGGLTKLYSPTNKKRRNFLFVQEVLSLKGWENWHPDFSSYLTMSFYNSVTFGPTDTYVLSRRGRYLIVLQVVLSLVVLLTFIARAFVIIK